MKNTRHDYQCEEIKDREDLQKLLKESEFDLLLSERKKENLGRVVMKFKDHYIREILMVDYNNSVSEYRIAQNKHLKNLDFCLKEIGNN